MNGLVRNSDVQYFLIPEPPKAFITNKKSILQCKLNAAGPVMAVCDGRDFLLGGAYRIASFWVCMLLLGVVQCDAFFSYD